MNSSAFEQRGPFYRQVTIEAAEKFANQEKLIWLGESSCRENYNIDNLFDKLIAKVHETQTELVRRGIKNIMDLKYGEEERKISYNRCCY